MITRFFTQPADDSSVRDTRSDSAFVSIDGADIRKDVVGTGQGPKFEQSDLAELARRSGVATHRLKEAMGQLDQYRLRGGLLHRKVYMRSTGSYEYLTVVPAGDWRTVEFGGVYRRLSLRRYVVMVFHLTPMGPHRSRDHTVQAIMDAGCWWQRAVAGETLPSVSKCQRSSCCHRAPTHA